MELCSGPMLQWVLDGRGALGELEAKAIMLQLVEALAHLHTSWFIVPPHAFCDNTAHPYPADLTTVEGHE